MSDPWIWCTCTSARAWGRSLASSSGWLDALVAGRRDDAALSDAASADGGSDTESTSAAYGAAVAATRVGTTTTRIPATWSATNSW